MITGRSGEEDGEWERWSAWSGARLRSRWSSTGWTNAEQCQTDQDDVTVSDRARVTEYK